jgi:hypothetical protein
VNIAGFDFHPNVLRKLGSVALDLSKGFFAAPRLCQQDRSVGQEDLGIHERGRKRAAAAVGLGRIGR